MNEMVNLNKYFESLQEFCLGEYEKLCTKELMNTAMAYVREVQNEINKKIFEGIKKSNQIERLRNRKNQQMKLMFKIHFLDRHF